MDFLQLSLIVLFMAKLGHMGRQKRLDTNDVFLLLSWIILLMFMRSLQCNTEYSAASGGVPSLDPVAWRHLNCLLSELFHDGKLTLPGNLVVKGNCTILGSEGLWCAGPANAAKVWTSDIYATRALTSSDGMPDVRIHGNVYTNGRNHGVNNVAWNKAYAATQAPYNNPSYRSYNEAQKELARAAAAAA